jgi:hypothetical protein
MSLYRLDWAKTMRFAASGTEVIQMEETQLDAIVSIAFEPNKRVPLGAVEIDGIGRRRGIVSLAHQVSLFVLESGSHFHLIADSQEQRTRVVRESRGQVPAKRSQI